ncbi:2-hydroxychromene-2-carboxylate isomerase [Octadecabacter sp.]|nr:2-hydroxychromene-2-carboxylate isomerase [Octadecabacter sp.]
MPHIDYYFATISPFTYLAGPEFEAVVAKHNATVTYKPLDIMGLFGRTGGVPPKDRHPNRQEYRLQDMRRRAIVTGLPFQMKPAHWPTNMAPSSYAIIAAQSAGGNVSGLVQALTRSCWADDKDIADEAVIRACLEEGGFDPELVNSGMLEGAETYAANLEEAVAKGVFGAPFFISDKDERFWGQDRIDDLDRHLAGEF